MNGSKRRDAANIAAWRQGIPQSQAGIDAMWRGIAGRLNATLPTTRGPSEARLVSPQAASARAPDVVIDWAGIANKLNAEAGFAPAR